MSENEAPWLLQVSLKSSGQSLINVRGLTAEDVRSGLADIIELADLIAEAETAVGAVQIVKGVMPGSRAVPDVVAPPVGAGPAGPSVTPPNCDHNIPAKFVPGGVSNTTKRPYKAFWACQLDRKDQCKFRQDA